MSKQISILVVDADLVFREFAANLLLACGVEKFQTVSSTEEALEKMATTFFDLVLLDLFMPQMKGLDFAQEIGKRTPETRIILMIEDKLLPVLNGPAQNRLNFPTILKSFVSRNLPQLLSEVLNSKASQ